MKLEILFFALPFATMAPAVTAFGVVNTMKSTKTIKSSLKMSEVLPEQTGTEEVNGFVDPYENLAADPLPSISTDNLSPDDIKELMQEGGRSMDELKKFLKNGKGFHFEQDEYWTEIRKHVTEAMTMPPEGFRSQDWYNVEQNKLFASTWQVGAFTDELREHGDVVTATIAGQPIMITRARDGELRGFFNVCRHRGARLVTEADAGKKKKCIACPYHNWGYSLDGKLLGTPLWNKESGMSEEDLNERLKAAFTTEDCKGFNKEDFGLLPVRVETWGPMVYVNVDGTAPPLEEYLGRCTEDLSLYPFKDLVTVRQQNVEVKANWKLLAENFLDYYHVPTVHPGYCDVSRVDDHDRSQGDGMYMCHVTYPLTNAGTALDLDRFPTMPGIAGTKHEITGWFHLHFPNMFYFLLPHSMFVVTIEPTSPTTSIEHVRLLVHKDGAQLQGETAEEAIEAMWQAYNKVNGEDFAICEECQKGVNVDSFLGGRMAWTFEESLNRFHKLVANCMTGKPHEIPAGDVIISKYDKIPLYIDKEAVIEEFEADGI